MAISKVSYKDDVLIDLSSDSVSASDVLFGKTFHDKTGVVRVGSMENYGSGTSSISSIYDEVTFSEGHYSSVKVTLSSSEKAKIIASNIKNGVSILGVTGTYAGEATESPMFRLVGSYHVGSTGLNVTIPGPYPVGTYAVVCEYGSSVTGKSWSLTSYPGTMWNSGVQASGNGACQIFILKVTSQSSTSVVVHPSTTVQSSGRGYVAVYQLPWKVSELTSNPTIQYAGGWENTDQNISNITCGSQKMLGFSIIGTSQAASPTYTYNNVNLNGTRHYRDDYDNGNMHVHVYTSVRDGSDPSGTGSIQSRINASWGRAAAILVKW